jgi:hypothetical protein
MKGDFSRTTFDPRKHYSGVLMQQGRVQVDADWNEQEAIQRRRTQVEARDVIGACGAPEDAAGFEVDITGTKLTIGAGRFYVDGILAESETDDLPYEDQPDLLDPPSWTDALVQAGASYGLVYLDVWERHLTALDDRLLREVALGAPDTATRVKTVWQVRVLPLDRGGDTVPDCDDTFPEWDALVADPGPPPQRAQPAADGNRRAVHRASHRRLPPAREPAVPGRGAQARAARQRHVQVVARQRHGGDDDRADQRQGRLRP